MQINIEGKPIANKNDVQSLMKINSTNECFITLKDHKDNFQNNPTTRLINPAKNEIGRISKIFLQSINNNLRKKIKVNQWNNTINVIDWFNGIPNKQNCKFLIFDIKDYYPSISEELLKKAIKFAASQVEVTKNEYETIFHSRKSLLYKNKEAWVKKDNDNFDVTMGAFDGAEICELIGLFLLNEIGKQYNKTNFGLYRDDGLAVFENISGPQADRIRKHFHAIFKKQNLLIETQCNIKIVNYLDVTLNLQEENHRPYKKPNDELIYINTKSDHPETITKKIPLSVEKRLSMLSSDEQIFEDSKQPYQQALDRCGYKHNLTYVNENANTPNRNRKRRTIWFNPPYSNSVSTRIGFQFIHLIDKHFTNNDTLKKLFNRKNLKISYSCMKNVKSTVNTHNRNIITANNTATRTCNCTNKEKCPLHNMCLKTNIVYQATIKTNDDMSSEKTYIGISEGTFKTRFANHKKSFNHEKYREETELSKEYWQMKKSNRQPIITFEILKECSSHNPESKLCNLCTNEKLFILENTDKHLLNKRNELVSKCRHRNKFKLENVRPKVKEK